MAQYYVGEDFWPLNTALYVRDFKGNDPRLIYYLLRAISPELEQTSSHTAVPTLDRKKAHSQINVHIPPLPEQRRIVVYFDELQAKVDAWLPAVLDRAFAINGQDIYFILEGKMRLDDAIRLKSRRAAETGEILVSVYELALQV
ncbi:MAG: restriction endonuclease subunit S [Candidatus Methanoperedens sp.]|nr:restriction endonuclease subunit S [Candidatus Methanoperedens sp.]